MDNISTFITQANSSRELRLLQSLEVFIFTDDVDGTTMVQVQYEMRRDVYMMYKLTHLVSKHWWY